MARHKGRYYVNITKDTPWPRRKLITIYNSMKKIWIEKGVLRKFGYVQYVYARTCRNHRQLHGKRVIKTLKEKLNLFSILQHYAKCKYRSDTFCLFTNVSVYKQRYGVTRRRHITARHYTRLLIQHHAMKTTNLLPSLRTDRLIAGKGGRTATNQQTTSLFSN